MFGGPEAAEEGVSRPNQIPARAKIQFPCACELHGAIVTLPNEYRFLTAVGGLERVKGDRGQNRTGLL